jgi:cell division transport system permease protein
MRVRFIVEEASHGLRRNLTMTAAALATITITLTLLGLALMLRHGANRVQSDVLNQLEVSVYLNQACGAPNAPVDCLTPAQRTTIRQTLMQLPQVKKVGYISSAEAEQKFKDDFKNEPDLIKALPANSLPESFVVYLKDPHQFQIIRSAVGEAPGVQTVNNAQQFLKQLFAFFRHLTVGSAALALVALIATCMLIYNTIRVAAFTRRREIGIMRLVGASNFYIQAPFVLEGTVIGIVGSVFAVLMLLGARLFLAETFSGGLLDPLASWQNFSYAAPIVAAVGVALSAVLSLATLQRHLRV